MRLIALLANNFEVKWVMSQVGHADSKMTMDVYAQLEQRLKRDQRSELRPPRSPGAGAPRRGFSECGGR